jgi:hypothetical protein
MTRVWASPTRIAPCHDGDGIGQAPGTIHIQSLDESRHRTDLFLDSTVDPTPVDESGPTPKPQVSISFTANTRDNRPPTAGSACDPVAFLHSSGRDSSSGSTWRPADAKPMGVLSESVPVVWIDRVPRRVERAPCGKLLGLGSEGHLGWSHHPVRKAPSS